METLSKKKAVVGTVLMLMGVLMTNANMPIFYRELFGNSLLQFTVGIMVIGTGFVIFTKALQHKRQKTVDKKQKSKHIILEIFGLE